jgi:NADH-quinone oxidoreductase subunit L
VSGIGAITALLAALIALTQNDLKRVLAYSTVSQLSYMFMALGAGAAGTEVATAAVTAGMFHLFTHAFFKALLFLAAGSVMHSMGDVIDMRRFGGLRKALPVTHWTFLCGAAALAGVPLLSGFWSKDDILAVLAEAAGGDSPHAAFFAVVRLVGTVTALLTAFYTFRAYFMTFWGEERFPTEAGHHPHDAPRLMAWPLRILAVCAVGIGFAVGPTHLFGDYLQHAPGLAGVEPHVSHLPVMLLSAVLAAAGIALAWWFYVQSPEIPERLATSLDPIYALTLNKFYLDEIYTWIVITPLRGLAWLAYAIDRNVIDPLVDGIGMAPTRLSWIPVSLQNGLVSSYALVMLSGVIVCVLVALGFLS